MKPIECKTRDGHRAVVLRVYKGKRLYPVEVKVFSKRFLFKLLPFTAKYEYYTIDGQYMGGYTQHPLDLVEGYNLWYQKK